MCDGFHITDFPNASAFVVTLKKEDGTIMNVATFNYDFGIDKEVMKVEAETFMSMMQLFRSAEYGREIINQLNT